MDETSSEDQVEEKNNVLRDNIVGLRNDNVGCVMEGT